LFSFLEVIDMAVQIEKNGEKTYLKACEIVPDDGLKELLSWMAEEEGHHARRFENLKLQTDVIYENVSLKEMNDALIQDYLGGETFSLKEVDFSAVTDPVELIRIFIEFEKDTILFYDFLIF